MHIPLSMRHHVHVICDAIWQQVPDCRSDAMTIVSGNSAMKPPVSYLTLLRRFSPAFRLNVSGSAEH